MKRLLVTVAVWLIVALGGDAILVETWNPSGLVRLVMLGLVIGAAAYFAASLAWRRV